MKILSKKEEEKKWGKKEMKRIELWKKKKKSLSLLSVMLLGVGSWEWSSWVWCGVGEVQSVLMRSTFCCHLNLSPVMIMKGFSAPISSYVSPRAQAGKFYYSFQLRLCAIQWYKHCTNSIQPLITVSLCPAFSHWATGADWLFGPRNHGLPNGPQSP